ncbi:MAG: substrate-binding domain-containing protein [Candidatus Latescibacteria bacterium]|nr:substrate-binding domain-containing protein [Candidatus Latescibacterota bacterium]
MQKSKLSACIAQTLGMVLAGAFWLGCGEEAPQPEEPQRTKIAGIVFQEDQFFRLIQFGMQDVADRADIELLLANSSNKPDKEIQLVNTYIARQVDAIVISPLSAKASATALKKARDKGIAVITYNSTVEDDIATTYIQSDQTDLGAQTGLAARQYIEDHLNGQAKIATLAFKTLLPEQSNQRSGGFIDQVSQLPGVEIVSQQDAWLPETAIKKAGDMLTAHPDIDIIWAANEGGTTGAVLAVKNAGHQGEVAVFGTDANEQLIGFLLSEDNILQAVSTQQPFDIGSKAVDFAIRALGGEAVEKMVSVPGILLSRQEPDKVNAFRDELQKLIGRATP